MKVTVAGGGNIGMCLVGEISRLTRYQVTFLVSEPELFESPIRVKDNDRGITFLSGDFAITGSVEEAVTDADIIFCTYPSFLRQKFIEEASPYLKEGARLGFVPGYGGAEYSCTELIKRGVTIFGYQKVPYVSRSVERGKIAGIWSKKTELYVGAIPYEKTNEIASLTEDMLQVPVHGLANYMNAVLLPGNPLLHTSGSYVYLKDYQPDTVYPEQIYYYQSWDDECSRVICDFSDEMMAICEALPIDLRGVPSIQEYYESPTPEELTVKFHTIPSFQPLVLPMTQVEGGFKPDFSSRFYTEDLPYGVSMLKALALLAGVETPTTDAILAWYEDKTGKQYFTKDGEFGKDINETAIPQLFGIDTPEKLRDFYIQ